MTPAEVQNFLDRLNAKLPRTNDPDEIKFRLQPIGVKGLVGWLKSLNVGLVRNKAVDEPRRGRINENGLLVIVSLCDYTGNWPEAYYRNGYTVIQVDIQRGHNAKRFPRLDCPVYGLMAAPVCRDFACSGNGSRERKIEEALAEGRDLIAEALSLVDACLRVKEVNQPAWWVLENPVGIICQYLGQGAMTFQPNEYAGWLSEYDEYAPGCFGADLYTKRTCLWGSFQVPEQRWLPAVRGSICHTNMGGGDNAERSVTPRGFSLAFYHANNADRRQVSQGIGSRLA